jgi:predicted RNase H-like HicB family nuclease
MNLVTFTYKIIPDGKWLVVECLDWNGIVSQGKTIANCKKNMVEVTEMFFELLKDKELDESQYPKPIRHLASPFTFQLCFDFDSGKHIPEKMIPFGSEINIIKEF